MKAPGMPRGHPGTDPATELFSPRVKARADMYHGAPAPTGGHAGTGRKARSAKAGRHLGTSTPLTTWMTPFDWSTSAMVTRAALPDSS